MKLLVWFNGLNIRRKVQYVFIFVIAACIICCSIFFFLLLRSRMTDTVIEKSRGDLVAISQSYQAIIDNVNNISKNVMLNSNVNAFLKAQENTSAYSKAACAEIYNIINSFSRSYSVFIFREDRSSLYTGVGIIHANSRIIYSDERYQKILAADGGYVLLPNTDGAFSYKSATTDIISFSRIINDIDTQKPIGMLVINIPITELEQTYADLADDNNHFAFLCENGKTLCTDTSFKLAGERSDTVGKIVQTPETKHLTRRAVSSSILLPSGLSIVSRSSVKMMEGVNAGLIGSAAGILVITLLAMLLINLYINHYITMPISKLADSMQKTDLELPERVNIRCGNDEIGMLQNSYNEMLTQLRRLIEKLLSEEKNRQKAEMDALQEQIKPHFLYNTLETISYMSLQNSRDEVYKAIETLGNFYRKFLSKGSTNVTLGEEMSIVRDYINLMKLRYDDMFDDRYYIEKGLEDIIVPKLILQPLVENSIYHGIRPKGEKGLIAVSASRENDEMKIVVYDSGVGMSDEQIERLMNGENKKSFGFKGTIDRIRYFCGRDDVVRINGAEGEYCAIEISIPITQNPHNNQASENPPTLS